ncbi:S1E (streptogrisin A) family peptidase [Kutzneria sp. 744]|nr:S1E (streptogrisin A) family peptidase [Kutzneria sp. 744]
MNLVRLGLSVMVTAGLCAGLGAPLATASPVVLAAMQHDLGLTAQQAQARLTEESAAMRLAPQAEQRAGDAFAGSWFDPATGKLVVAVTDQHTAATVRGMGVQVATATVNAKTLQANKSAIDNRSRAHRAPAEVASWGVDARTNSVVITVRGQDAAVQEFVAAARKNGPVTVRQTSSPQPQVLSAGTVGGDPYYINGNVRCSIGFSVSGGFVSAGHCGQPGYSVVGWDGSAMGSFAGSTFPGNDFSYIRTGNGWWQAPVVLGWGTVSDALVRGDWVAPPGTSVCRSGSTSHWHCGTVEALGDTVNYAQGAVYNMTRTTVCAEPGDSGGSFITGDQAQGVTSGGYGNCSSGGETWFQPVGPILAAYGVGLVTP